MMKREAVISLIDAAFAGVVHPGDVLLHPSCRDDTDIRPFYGVRDWRSIDSHLIETSDAALCFFSPAAFQYFLPAFMVWTLDNCSTSDSFTVDATIYSLDPTTSDGPQQRFMLSKYALLSDQQRRAIVVFLEQMSKNPDHCDAEAAESALAKYWKRK